LAAAQFLQGLLHRNLGAPEAQTVGVEGDDDRPAPILPAQGDKTDLLFPTQLVQQIDGNLRRGIALHEVFRDGAALKYRPTPPVHHRDHPYLLLVGELAEIGGAESVLLPVDVDFLAQFHQGVDQELLR